MRSLYRICVVLFFFSGALHADLGLILSEPLPEGIAKWTQSGHSAVYLSNVCADTPVHLRLCQPGEQGVVVSNYKDFKESGRYQWNAAPLGVFLYGVEDANIRPVYASRELRLALQDRYRKTWLRDLCTTAECIDNREASWRDMVAESFVRTMYMFQVNTTLEQDRRFIAEFNSRTNVNHYNGFRNNCATFAVSVVNFYFPHAAHGDRLNDFGVVSPKGIARSFSKFARHHPDLDYRVMRISQIPGDLPKSNEVRSATELAFRSKRWLIPMFLLRGHELVLFSATYLITGRFSPEKEFRQHAGTDIGTVESWTNYRSAFQQLASANPSQAEGSVSRIAHDYDQHASIIVDDNGLAWAEIPEPGGSRRLGLDTTNVLSSGSDPELAYRILLAKTQAELKTSADRRESLPEFASDWELLENSKAAMNEGSSTIAEGDMEVGNHERP